jgi:uncharacterized membrane protein
MSPIKILAIVLIVGGVAGLVYGGFTYTKGIHEANLGPIAVAVADRQWVNVPVGVGVGAIVVGAALLLFGGRKP